MLAIISWVVSAVIFILIGLTTVLEDTEDVRWTHIGFFFLVLGLILYALSGPYERWRGRVP
jgi:hypothetical protein